MAKKKKNSGQVVNRKTKDYKPNTDASAPFKKTGTNTFDPLRPKVQPSPHSDGRPSAGGRNYSDAQRKAQGIGKPMGNFDNSTLNPRNAKDRKEIKKRLDYMYTHNTSGYANHNFDRTADKKKFAENYQSIDWGRKKDRKQGKKYKKKY